MGRDCKGRETFFLTANGSSKAAAVPHCSGSGDPGLGFRVRMRKISAPKTLVSLLGRDHDGAAVKELNLSNCP